MVGIARSSNMAAAAAEEVRKGPWTEQEDVQLVLCVNVYGDRRWDFVAKVSGLKRTGKSCRLRWVNYLHPGLKRGKMAPHEERLVLELHSKWGNRWSRIARKLPGRTDNEIKNYWRTHMRKQAQERKKGGGAAASSPSSSTSTSTTTASSSSGTSTSTSSSAFSKCFSNVSIGNSPPTEESAKEDKARSFYDTGGLNKVAAADVEEKNKAVSSSIPVDEIWKDMDFFGGDPIKPVYNDYGYGGTGAVASSMASPVWDYYPIPLWTMDEEAEDICKKFPPISDQFYSMNSAYLTG